VDLAGVALTAALLAGACSHSSAKAKIAKLPVASLPAPTTAAPSSGGPAAGSHAQGAPPSSAPTAVAGTGAKAAFVAGANAVCKATNTQLDKLGNDLNDPTAAQDADVLDKGAGLMQSMLDQLHALPQPPDDPVTLSAFYDASAQAVAVVRQAASQLRAGDLSALTNLSTQAAPLNTTADRAAVRFGMTECQVTRDAG
jgi:hypothetical protein